MDTTPFDSEVYVNDRVGKRHVVQLVGHTLSARTDVVLCGFSSSPGGFYRGARVFDYQHGEADSAMFYAARATADWLRLSEFRAVVVANDTDVLLAGLVAVSHQARGHYWLCQGADAFIDLRALCGQLQHYRISAADLALLYAIAGCDYTSPIGGVGHTHVITHYVEHREFVTAGADAIVRWDGTRVVYDDAALLRLFFALVVVKNGNASLLQRASPDALLAAAGGDIGAALGNAQMKINLCRDMDQQMLRAVAAVSVWHDVLFAEQQQIDFEQLGWKRTPQRQLQPR